MIIIGLDSVVEEIKNIESNIEKCDEEINQLWERICSIRKKKEELNLSKKSLILKKDDLFRSQSKDN